MSGSIYRSTDPLRPVDWRAQSAEFIVNTDRVLLGGGHDRLTAEVVRFLRWERPLGRVSASHEAAFHAGFVPGRNPKATAKVTDAEVIPPGALSAAGPEFHWAGFQRPTRQLSTPDSFQEGTQKPRIPGATARAWDQ